MADGIRTRDPQIHNLETVRCKVFKDKDLRPDWQAPAPHLPNGSAVGAPDLPADLVEIVSAWPTLPPAIKAAILAMIHASGKGDER